MVGIPRAGVAPLAVALSLAASLALDGCRPKGGWRVGSTPDAGTDAAQADAAPSEAGRRKGGTDGRRRGGGRPTTRCPRPRATS